MLPYFKHIIHIDDFPLNGHPPSSIELQGDNDQSNFISPGLLYDESLYCFPLNGLQNSVNLDLNLQ